MHCFINTVLWLSRVLHKIKCCINQAKLLLVYNMSDQLIVLGGLLVFLLACSKISAMTVVHYTVIITNKI